MGSREIVTLQIGHYSNFVGTHWWNLQESSFLYNPSVAQQKEKEVDHDVLWREGSTLKNETTFTPRLIAVDLKGSLNTLKQEGVLYEINQQEDIKWSGDITLHKSATTYKNAYLLELEKEDEAILGDKEKLRDAADIIDDVEMKDSSSSSKKDVSSHNSQVLFGKIFHNLDDVVKVWSDYIRVYLHPKTVHIVEQYSHQNTLHPFDIYGAGHKAMEDYEARMELEDRIHYFCEECDSLQGFHVLLDTHDGFGGIAAQTLQHLQDEYSSKAVMSFGLTPANLPDDTPVRRANRILNSALSYHTSFTQSSQFFPLSLANSLWKTIGDYADFPQLDYKLMDYHTSAILAATLDTATLPYRTVNPIHMCDIANSFQSHGKKVGSVSAALPMMLETESNFVDMVQGLEGTLPWLSITPHCLNQANPYMQSVVVRGIPENMPRSPRGLYSSCRSVNDTLQVYLTENFISGLSAGTVIKSPAKVSTPFPHIFKKSINRNGFLSTNQRLPFEGVDTVPMMTSMQSSPDCAQLLNTLYTEAKKLNIRKHTRYLESGLEEDEFQDMLQELAAQEKCYKPNSDMG
ncbi:protein misato homolog 1-like [Ostrea edulis]|uniref:protein misato homolog 1-like n=1 Tax=Ostrea edulis TaxID=37623 RepID=UPI0020941F29|nr:protein misato homolog 1-like [Ostrea edulis]